MKKKLINFKLSLILFLINIEFIIVFSAPCIPRFDYKDGFLGADGIFSINLFEENE